MEWNEMKMFFLRKPLTPREALLQWTCDGHVSLDSRLPDSDVAANVTPSDWLLEVREQG